MQSSNRLNVVCYTCCLLTHAHVSSPEELLGTRCGVVHHAHCCGVCHNMPLAVHPDVAAGCTVAAGAWQEGGRAGRHVYSSTKYQFIRRIPQALLSTCTLTSPTPPAPSQAEVWLRLTHNSRYTDAALAAARQIRSHVIAVDPLQLQPLLRQPRTAHSQLRVPVTWGPVR
jgi:hypothetical protein